LARRNPPFMGWPPSRSCARRDGNYSITWSR
jgi:hypothetical protein